MIQIYGKPRTRAIRALWAAEEVGIPYESINVDFSKRENLSPEFLKLNPYGKVPVLVEGSVVVFESAAICQYLASKKPSLNLVLPLDHPERPLYDQWLSFAMTELEYGLWNIGKHQFANPKEYRLEGMQAVGLWEFKKAEEIIALHLEDRRFFLNAGFTVVDIMVAQMLMWAKSTGIPLHATCERYMGEMRTRQAFLAVKAKFLAK